LGPKDASEAGMGKIRIAERTCMGCGRKAPKSELLRFVRDGDGGAVFDVRQEKPGRGGYLCPRVSCFPLAAKKRRKARGEQAVRIEAVSLLGQVGKQLAAEARNLVPERSGAVPDLLAVAGVGVAGLSEARSRKARQVVKIITAFFGGGGTECPT
jgi:uncharacterized protein